ncbi:DAK2 domain-containing protein [Halarsenatibacter silvermanii]|uniref:DhaL domain-containing protein n=1 Tax=Halarsenatibacter silvermanii TaxID=321763 RepID=A0A1G9NRF1_9FIRM|nr:DAK2 domain-containing protein [Halarsenatibacter silvermanii]SDL89186.1 hypothetical protein SAMN04488692_11110 [Halarsenatibacter silvermanii]
MSSGRDRAGQEIVEAQKLKKMFEVALQLLENKKSIVNSLNVFPVPDGDTGTNMFLTLKEAIEEINGSDSEHAGEICHKLSRGALMGARGNSGVILSQLLRGFAQENREKEVLEAEDFVSGFDEASRVAYKGVLKPVEGTILTVSRKAAEGAQKALDESNDLQFIFEETRKAAEKALNKTPEQLSVLKEADVVDAGGQGFVFILEGMLRALKGEEPVKTVVDIEDAEKDLDKDSLEHTYCTQLLINLENNDGQQRIDKIRKELNNYGSSLMVVGSDNIIKVHIHTDHPGVILENALRRGMLEKISIENMYLQQEETHEDFIDGFEADKTTASGVSINNKADAGEAAGEHNSIENKSKKRGIVACSAGQGVADILMDLGVDEIIRGGQSMNPSTNDFLSVLEEIPCEEVIILPNNKNIISAARQAAELCQEKEVEVVPTRAFTEAIASLLAFDDQGELKDIVEQMKGELEYVKTIEITEAVKDSNLKDLSIEEGEVIGIVEGDITGKGENYHDVALRMVKENHEFEDLITIYYGEEISEEEAEKLQEEIKKSLDDNFELEVEIYSGGQPLYPYIISLE